MIGYLKLPHKGKDALPYMWATSLMCLLCALGVQAQSSATVQQSPVLKTETRVVQVDVLVTDGQGRPIQNLTKDDFTLSEEGHPQQIAYFTPHLSMPAAGEAPAPSAVSPVVTEGTTSKQEEVSEPLTILLIDRLNTASRDQANFNQQLIQYLRRDPALSQPVALLILSDSIRLLQRPTKESKLLIEALQRNVGTRSEGMALGEAFSLTPLEAQDMTPQMLESLDKMNQQLATQAVDDRVSATLNAFTIIAHLIAGNKGRKSIIWLSAAFPMSVVGSSQTGANAAKMEQVNALFSQERIAVYPVDVRGVVSAPDQASNSDTLFDTITELGDPSFDEQATRKTAIVESSNATMEDLAIRTGGKAFINRNNLGPAIAQSLDDNLNYYTLEYYPSAVKWDGKFHRIKIRVTKHGLKLRYRSGYYAVNAPFTQP